MPKMKKFLIGILSVFLIVGSVKYTYAQEAVPEFYAKYVYVMDNETGRCLYEKNGYDKTAMASTTKIMTAIIVLEHGDLNSITTVSANAASTGGSIMHLKKNEKISVNDLLFGLLIKSGNDAAVALAEAVSGSVEEFCKLMNAKAKSLGANDTHFTSPHGLDNDEHYTTARDLAIIASYAMKNNNFRQIVSTKTANVNGHYLANTNDLLWSAEGVEGIKTGYTGNAGRCVVLFIHKNDIQLIGVLLGCETSDQRSADGKNMANYFPGNYSVCNVLEAGAVIDTVKSIKSKTSYVPVIVKEPVTLCLSQKELADIHFKEKLLPEYENGVRDGIKAGTVMGKYSVYTGDSLLCETDLIAAETCVKKAFGDYLQEFFTLWAKKTFGALYNF